MRIIKSKKNYFAIVLCVVLAILSQNVYSQETLDSIANVKTVIVENEDFDVLSALGFNVSYSEELERMAKNSNAAAQNYLGNCLLNGNGIDANPEQAFYWFSKSAMGNNTKAMNQLGYCYEEGIGTEIDSVQAYLFYKKAAFRGHPNAYVNLAKCYYLGIGTHVDILRAKAWFEKGAEEGIGIAQSNVGQLYLAEKNYDEAYYWLKKACEQNFAYACEYLGDCYDNGWGCERNHQKAIECYKKSIELGNKNASIKLNK